MSGTGKVYLMIGLDFRKPLCFPKMAGTAAGLEVYQGGDGDAATALFAHASLVVLAGLADGQARGLQGGGGNDFCAGE